MYVRVNYRELRLLVKYSPRCAAPSDLRFFLLTAIMFIEKNSQPLSLQLISAALNLFSSLWQTHVFQQNFHILNSGN